MKKKKLPTHAKKKVAAKQNSKAATLLKKKKSTSKIKLTKQAEEALLKAYYDFWESNLSADMKKFSSYLVDDFSIFGSANGEVFFSKRDTVKFYTTTAEELRGKAQLRNRKISIQPLDSDSAVVREESDLYVLIGKNWSFYGHARISCIVKYIDRGWKAVHQHASFPDHRTEEGQQLASEKIEKENLELRDAVKRRTVELEHKNRELEIEAALERVRAKSMGMQQSAELKEVIQVVFEQFVQLKINLDHAGFVVDYKPKGDWHFWIADEQEIPSKISHPYFDSVWANQFNEAKKKRMDFFATNLNFKEKNRFYRDLFKHVPGLSETSKKFYFKSPGLAISTVLLKDVGLYIENFSGTPYTNEENNTLMRFGKVFQQAFTRFLDLQKAEAQAREAKIEAALERVRARTMAMYRSDELASTVKILFEEFTKLNDGKNLGSNNRGFITTVNEDEKCFDLWITEIDGSEISNQFVIAFNEGTTGKAIHEAWLARKPYLISDLQGERLNEWLNYLTNIGFKVAPGLYGTRRVNNFIYYSKGFIGITSSVPLSENNIHLLQRFAKVFEQTYTRFLDLQKAEAQALEAIKRASVDRIRAEIASMRTKQDLDRITPLIWRELTTLGIPFVRCGVFIMDDDRQSIHTFLSTPDGRAIAAFELPYASAANLNDAITGWRDHKRYVAHWVEKDFSAQADTLVHQRAITSREQYLKTIPTEGIHLHFLPFPQGMLYVGNTASLNEEQLDLIQTVAHAFSTAYARYEDFSKLEAAKQQVDKTLVDLKLAQQQLIQSEKMASLGELTAGIAHEIQNPLNFVNNFSEVNTELIDELKKELAVGNKQSADELVDDIKSNSEKINHHGKRAGDIVKSMLQHSRSSSGVKEATDINALADEYLRLAYHGLRAKDKSFNATMKTEFDETIGVINIIPQDIGRVILNLITNAFYAVSEKSKVENQKSGVIYEPTVIVSTKKLSDKIAITVKDNGNGIPESIKEKIFQPFFTTKPTGQGTGLGLSLSYDIVKAHGGQLKVETMEGEGTTFIIIIPFT